MIIVTAGVYSSDESIDGLAFWKDGDELKHIDIVEDHGNVILLELEDGTFVSVERSAPLYIGD